MSGEKVSDKRRWLLIGGGAAAVAAAIGLMLGRPAPKPVADIVVKKVDEVPRRDPASPIWDKAESHDIKLIPQSIVKPMKTTEITGSVNVKALHDGEWIGFRLEWGDPNRDDSVVRVGEFKDACAVMLLSHPVSGLAWRMGTSAEAATILQWRADWQRDLEKGFTDLETAFPNVAVDAYQHVGVEGVSDGKPKSALDLADKNALTFVGFAAGNIFSEMVRDRPVEKLLGLGPGTITTLPTQDADGWGVWSAGKWSVVVAKKLGASDAHKGEISITPGNLYTVAFAVWNGAVGDRGSRKSISSLMKLYVE